MMNKKDTQHNKETASSDKSTPDLFQDQDISTEYASFTRRLYASLIDMTLAALLLTYIIAPFTNVFIYGENSPTVHLKREMSAFSYSLSQAEGEEDRLAMRDEMLSKMEDYFVTQNKAADYLFEQLFQVFIIIVIIALFWHFKAATPGKLVMRIRVVDEKSGAKPDLVQCFIRIFSYAFSMLPLCIGFFWMKYHKRHQCFHDSIAGTVVVRIIRHE